MLVINPYAFGAAHWTQKTPFVLLIFFSSFFIPVIAIVLMRATGLISSMAMEDKMDRIFPYVASGIFYLWIVRNLWSNEDIPSFFTAACLGTVIALFLCFVANTVVKPSVHAAGAGGILSVLLMSQKTSALDYLPVYWGPFLIDPFALVFIAVILAGLICTSRLYLNAHRPGEIFLGFIFGMISQFFAYSYFFS